MRGRSRSWWLPRAASLVWAVAMSVVAATAGCTGGGAAPRADGSASSRPSKVRARADAGPARSLDGAPGAGDGAAGGDDGGGEVTTPVASVSDDPSLPPEQRWPLHGVALFHKVNIYSQPNSRSDRIGVLRRGERVRVGPAHEGRGCKGGRWHPVRPRGYVCSGRTMRIGEEPPPLAFTPTLPAVDQASPYQYGRNRRAGVPLYRRIPRPSELAAEREYQAWLAEQRAAKRPPDAGPPTEEELEAFEEERERRSRTGPIVTRLERGFYVTIERIIVEDGRRWVRTAELNYVDASAIYKRRIPDIQGAELGDDLTLPIVINMRDSKSRRLDARGRPRLVRQIEAYTPLPLLGETTLGAKTFYTVGDNEIVDADRWTKIVASDPPPGVGPDERWIEVNVRHQYLVAYEGARPVYATLVSTGDRGHDTPLGEFRITSKYISTDMSDAPEGGEPYLIQDVPWTMYFHLAIALHGAFWHSQFGRRRSHGCVNLALADARWLFYWVSPELPESWHGVTATEDNPGTRVYVHR